jgi:hypothetical protein
MSKNDQHKNNGRYRYNRIAHIIVSDTIQQHIDRMLYMRTYTTVTFFI